VRPGASVIGVTVDMTDLVNQCRHEVTSTVYTCVYPDDERCGVCDLCTRYAYLNDHVDRLCAATLNVPTVCVADAGNEDEHPLHNTT
jgi:hypothetical protein